MIDKLRAIPATTESSPFTQLADTLDAGSYNTKVRFFNAFRNNRIHFMDAIYEEQEKFLDENGNTTTSGTKFTFRDSDTATASKTKKFEWTSLYAAYAESMDRQAYVDKTRKYISNYRAKQQAIKDTIAYRKETASLTNSLYYTIYSTLRQLGVNIQSTQDPHNTPGKAVIDNMLSKNNFYYIQDGRRFGGTLGGLLSLVLNK